MSEHRSIRDQLEEDAWRNHTQFAHRLASAARPENRRRLAWQDRALLILASVLVLLLIIRVEAASADDSEPFWGLEFPDGTATRRVLALDTAITVRVTALTARVEVSQLFRNDGLAWAEATYRYPLPVGAAVDRMTIRAGDRLIEG